MTEAPGMTTLQFSPLDASAHLGTSPDAPGGILRLQGACRRLEQLASAEAPPTGRFHQVIAHVHDLCAAIDEAESSGLGSAELRTLVGRAREIHRCSPFIRRLQDWPRGYPGDFETIEWLWQGDNQSQPDTLAHAFERYALTSAIAQQHRNKVQLQASFVRSVLSGRTRARVLFLGSGSSPDLRSVAGDVPPGSRFVLCDGDPEALAFARTKLPSLEAQCTFVQGMVPRVLRRLGGGAPFDLILAGGLFDYLSDRFIVRTLRDCWHDLLAPGGRIVFTNIASGNPFRGWLEYLADWRLVERSEADIASLCRAADIPVVPATSRDATGLAIVAVVQKEPLETALG
jgi:hypothetical protein